MQEEDKILEKDSDEEKDNGSLYYKDTDYKPLETEINIQEDPQSVFQYVRMYKLKRIKIDPEYQRNLVWKEEQKSRLIESILMNFPLPPFYLNQEKSGNYFVIDGLQRTTTLIDFLDGKFELQGLKVLRNLNGKSFQDLDSNLQAKIEERKIILYILKPSVPMVVIYELFDRINTGGTPLNRQEVRHCIFVGQSTQLLKELAQEDYFKEAINFGVSPTRMKDRELILRFLAFKTLDFQTKYTDNLSDFLEEAMMNINKMDEPTINSLKKDFKRVMEYTFDFFGEKNFRFPVIDKDGRKSIGFINTAVFETVCNWFSLQTDDFLNNNKSKIIENFNLLLQDSTYNRACRTSTGTKFNVESRFSKVNEILGNVK